VKVATSDGRTLEWTGLNICYCTKCEELFNSVAAFDRHLKRGKGQKAEGVATHDITGMPRNGRGYLVTALRESGAEW
jgi:hypothetical protein